MRGQQSAIGIVHVHVHVHAPRPHPSQIRRISLAVAPLPHGHTPVCMLTVCSRLVLAQLQLHQRRLAREQLQRARGVWLQKNGLQPALQPWAFSTLLTAAPSGERPVGLCNAQNPHAPLSNSFALESGGAFRRPWSQARRRAALRCTKHQQHPHPQHPAAAALPSRPGWGSRGDAAVQHERCAGPWLTFSMHDAAVPDARWGQSAGRRSSHAPRPAPSNADALPFNSSPQKKLPPSAAAAAWITAGDSPTAARPAQSVEQRSPGQSGQSGQSGRHSPLLHGACICRDTMVNLTERKVAPSL